MSDRSGGWGENDSRCRSYFGVFLVSRMLLGCAADAADATEENAAETSSALTGSPSCDLGRETLAANDGWASAEPGTSGGSAATPEQVFVVGNRAGLIAALNNGVSSPISPSAPSSAPKIIYVDGSIDFNVDEADQPLRCEDYYRNGYTIEAFLAAYDLAVWGRVAPSGALEDARVASQLAQQARVRIRVGSNTTIVGIGKRARLRGVWLDLRGSATQNVTNIVIRNLTFQDSFDCFPVWSPSDGALGSWNALYDAISLRNADHVWIDHNTFRDRETADEAAPTRFGVLYQAHDGHLDITNASDLVTVSYNRFLDHDKVMLIGSSDSASADRGKLRVTIHHNLFDGVHQRAPRVRFGQVDVYDNYYKVENDARYQYSWGVGIESALYAENNSFKADQAVDPARFIGRFNGNNVFEAGTQLNGTCKQDGVDLVQAWNAANDPDLSEAVGWIPTLRLRLEPTRDVPRAVQDDAGPFSW